MSILRYLKGHVPVLVAIVCLLAVQVVCDLSIPRCTSNIVDVGIQQGGVADAVPDRLGVQTLADLKAVAGLLADAGKLDADAAATIGDAFEVSSAQEALLKDACSSGAAREALARALALPEAALGELRAQAGGEDGAHDLLASQARGGSVGALLGAAEDGAEQLSDSLVEQRACAFVLDEYAALGVDTGAYQTSYLLACGAKMLGLTLLSLLAAVAVGALASRTGAFIARDLREAVFSNVLSFSRADMQRFGAASLITRCTNDIQLIQTTVVMLLRIVLMAPVMGVAASVLVALTAPGLAWIVVVAVAAIACVVAVLMRATLPRFRMMQKLVDRVNLVSREALTGVPVVRAFGRERREEERFEDANANLTSTSLFTGRAMSLMMPVMMLIMNGTSIAVMWFGSTAVSAGDVQVGDLIAFINYAMQVCMSFMMITMVAIMLPRAQVAADRVDEVAHAVPDVADPAPERAAPRPAGGWRGEVSFEHASLRFAGAEADVLHDVTLTVRPGTTTAVIGPTGSGKSTLARLVLRLYDVTQGRVAVDGVDVRSIPQHELRRLVGYIPQTATLFSGTVRSNIAYADPAMPEERVRRAAEVACADEFIKGMPGGFDAPIAQGGANVSGGQRQRLSIARAAAAEPRVFVFDDSFSALDFATDAKVRANLARAAGDAAMVVVAQRVATVLDADQIVVLDEGRVVGLGTHLELMESCPTYREIAQGQLSAAEIERIARAKRGGEA